jgi:hypothetical protein
MFLSFSSVMSGDDRQVGNDENAQANGEPAAILPCDGESQSTPLVSQVAGQTSVTNSSGRKRKRDEQVDWESLSHAVSFLLPFVTGFSG